MATIEIETDSTMDLTVIKVEGDLVQGQLRAALDEYYKGPVSLYCIIDMSNGSWSNIPIQKFKQGVENSAKYDRKGGKTALVFGNDADFGIGRMIESNLILGNFQKQVECFRNRKKANQWILEN
ncbi:MAG: hypothetical protein WD772_10600 [Pseudohongiellaceae bacterium]